MASGIILAAACDGNVGQASPSYQYADFLLLTLQPPGGNGRPVAILFISPPSFDA
jgi:hypothetical protein